MWNAPNKMTIIVKFYLYIGKNCRQMSLLQKSFYIGNIHNNMENTNTGPIFGKMKTPYFGEIFHAKFDNIVSDIANTNFSGPVMFSY